MREDGDKHCGLSVYIWQAGRQEEMKEADNPLLLLLVTQLHLTLCDPTDCNMTAFPVLPCTRNTDSFQTKYLKKKNLLSWKNRTSLFANNRPNNNKMVECTYLFLQELQNCNALLYNHQQENVGAHQKMILHIQGQREAPTRW